MKDFLQLRQAADAALDLGLEDDARRAEHVLSEVEGRMGFEGTAYVLALAGGTGVGKSSLLNALAGSPVSEVSPLRPTTSRPLAWVAASQRVEVAPLLEWLGVEAVITHDREELSGMVILDLPDFDSVAVDHRATVDRLLPRIDSMLWVVDTEKYDDELLHAYLRDLTPHAERIGFVFNKSDRLDTDGQKLVGEDFRRRLRSAGYPRPDLFIVSAKTGDGVEPLVNALRRRADDKELVVKKLEADLGSSLVELAAAAGVDKSYAPLVDDRERESATADAVRGALAIVDPEGVAAQVRAAVLYRARRQGGSLLARVLALLSNLTGTRRKSADPAGFLLAWNQRGSLGHVLNPVRRLLVDSVSRLPGRARPGVMRKLDLPDLEARLTKSIDGAVRSARNDLEVARSMLWVLVGVLQLILGAAFLFAVAWYLTLIFGPGSLPVGTVEIPYLGPVPIPLALIVGSLVASLLLGLLLNLHASWIGRRRGARVASAVRTAIESTIGETAFRPLDQIEAARRRISEASSGTGLR